MTGPESQPDEDQDLRHMLQSQLSSTSAAHDAAVLKAARDFSRAQVPVGRDGPTPRSSSRARRLLVTSWVAAAAITAIVITGALWREQAFHREVQALTEERAALTRRVAELQGGSRQTQVLTLLSTVLTPGVTRGEDSFAEVEIPPDVGAVRLRLEVAPTANRRNYEMSLATRAGKEVWRGGPLAINTRGSPQTLTAEIPATLLGSGDYELSLREGNGQTDYYYFKVRRE